MMSTLFSPLSRGCGSWDGDLEPKTKKTLAKPIFTQRKKDVANYMCLTKSLSIPLRGKNNDLLNILKDACTTTRSESSTMILQDNFTDLLHANTQTNIQTHLKSMVTNSRFQPEILLRNSRPDIHSNTAFLANRGGVQSAASFSLPDRIRSAPPRPLRTTTSPVVRRKALIPKTLTTRKGALLLFAAPGDFDFTQPQEEECLHVPTGPSDASELGALLGTTNKMTSSVLQYGNENYPGDLESFNSQYDKTCMRFVKEDDRDLTLDYRAQPGGDFVFYLRDMQTRQIVRNLTRSPSIYSLSSVDTDVELHDALCDIDGHSTERDGLDTRSQRSTLITADAEKLAETVTKSSTAKIDAISRPTTGRFSRASALKNRHSRPSTSKSMCSIPLSAEKLAASIKSASYLGRPIRAPYPPNMASVNNFQDETRSVHTGPCSENYVRSVPIKSRTSSARDSRSEISDSLESDYSGDCDQGIGRTTEGAISKHGDAVAMLDKQRLLTRTGSLPQESWLDGGSDADLVVDEDLQLFDPVRPNSPRLMWSRQSRHSSARRSTSLEGWSMSGAGYDVGGEDSARQPSAKSFAIPTEDKEYALYAVGATPHSSHYESRSTSHCSQLSSASDSISIPMGSELEIPRSVEFEPDVDQHIREHLDEQAEDLSTMGTPKAITLNDFTPQGTGVRSAPPRLSSWQRNKNITSDHPPDDTNKQKDVPTNFPLQENIEEVLKNSPPEEIVEEVVHKVVEVADEGQDDVSDIDVSILLKVHQTNLGDAQSSSANGVLEKYTDKSIIKTPLPPRDSLITGDLPHQPTIAPLKTPKAVPVNKPPPVPQKRVMIAATLIKAKSRSPSPATKSVVEQKTSKFDLESLQSIVSKGQPQPTRIPPSQNEKKGSRKKRTRGERGRSRLPPSALMKKFDEPTVEEFEQMLQEELAKELANSGVTSLLKPEKLGEKPEDDMNSLATDDEAIAKQVKESNKGKKRTKKQISKERATLKGERRQEKMRREEEKRELAKKKKQRDAERQRQEELDKQRREVLAEQLADAEEEARRAAAEEEDARQMLQESRRLAREERDAKRKTEIEKKTIQREKQRQERKKMEDAAREREREMAERLASAAERKKMREEAEWEQQERDRIEQVEREMEEEEEKLRFQEMEERYSEIERQAEEEALQRLVKERQEAEERTYQAKVKAERLRQDEEKKRQEELKKRAEAAEIRRQQELEEEKRCMEELEKNRALKLLEQRACDRVRRKLESRRQHLITVRDKNREHCKHLNSVRQTQGITRSWEFSYYVHWPRDAYEKKRLPSKKNKRRSKPAPNPPSDKPGSGGKQVPIVANSGL